MSPELVVRVLWQAVAPTLRLPPASTSPVSTWTSVIVAGFVLCGCRFTRRLQRCDCECHRRRRLCRMRCACFGDYLSPSVVEVNGRGFPYFCGYLLGRPLAAQDRDMDTTFARIAAWGDHCCHPLSRCTPDALAGCFFGGWQERDLRKLHTRRASPASWNL